MEGKLTRIDWFKHGNCWAWFKINKTTYYAGNMIQFTWGRIAFVFERL